MFEEVLQKVKEKNPLVHCITNYVTVNDCANAILAIHGSPIMADEESEVEEITSICDALLINIGTLNKRTLSSMIKAGKKANDLKHPLILDPVGAGASTLRTQATFKLLKELKFSIIRGNISEIKTVYAGSGTTRGVDANQQDEIKKGTLEDSISLAQQLSEKTGAVICITGAIDIVANAQHAYIIRNGHPEMSKITGTGCMLSAMLGVYAAAYPQDLLQASACALVHMGLSGELAYNRMMEEKKGTGSLHMYILDYLSLMNEEMMKGGQKVEFR